MSTSLFSFFYVTGEFHRFLHQGRAIFILSRVVQSMYVAFSLLSHVLSNGYVYFVYLKDQ